jgi:hypothetical protein
MVYQGIEIPVTPGREAGSDGALPRPRTEIAYFAALE